MIQMQGKRRPDQTERNGELAFPDFLQEGDYWLVTYETRGTVWWIYSANRVRELNPGEYLVTLHEDSTISAEAIHSHKIKEILPKRGLVLAPDDSLKTRSPK